MLDAFAEWGLDALPRLNGMFAVAFCDSLRRDCGWLVTAAASAG